MENFRRQFLHEANETLVKLSHKLQGAKTIDGSLKLEVFRILHTIKGTAQTFGFADSSRLAHELENLLSVNKTSLPLLIEGVGLLIESLTEKNFEFPVQFSEKIRLAFPSIKSEADNFDVFSSQIPEEIFSQLSNQEKKALQSAIRDDKQLFCLEVNFELSKFADELINFRSTLGESGEIIATFPSSKFNLDGEIGFQILFATREVLPPLDSFGAEIVFQTSPDNFSGVSSVLEQAAKHGTEVAKKLDKQIKFKVYAENTDVSAQRLKLIFDVILHLVRNAVDHGIEQVGEININFSNEENGFRLRIADNGRGIELGKVREKAFEKHLISADAVLNEKETLDLIFSPEFSTTSGVTEISGRGIGLDVVKNLIENVGGQISISSSEGKGTTFDIFIPN